MVCDRGSLAVVFRISRDLVMEKSKGLVWCTDDNPLRLVCMLEWTLSMGHLFMNTHKLMMTLQHLNPHVFLRGNGSSFVSTNIRSTGDACGVVSCFAEVNFFTRICLPLPKVQTISTYSTLNGNM